MHAQTNANISKTCVEIHLHMCLHAYSTNTLSQCVTVVCFIHRACEELKYRQCDGRTLKNESIHNGLSSAVLFILTPACHASREMPVINSCPAYQRHLFPCAALRWTYRHNPMVHSLWRG